MSHEEGERRSVDAEWRKGIDEKMRKLIEDMEANTRITAANGVKLMANIAYTEELSERLMPVVDAMDTMRAGIVVIGKIGSGLAWLAKWAWRAVKVVAPVVAAIGTAYVAFHDQFIWVVDAVKQFFIGAKP